MDTSSKNTITDISIHALREEGDDRLLYPHQRRAISIHALREEGDYAIKMLIRQVD